MTLTESSHQPGRVLMIGLDSLEASLLEQFMAEGRLPNLEAFCRSAERLEVRSKGNILHGATWPTFSTATNAGTHGVYFWVQWLAEEMRHVRNDHPAFAVTPWWAELAATGRRATVVDVPYIAPVELPGFRTYMGWGLHDEVVPVAYPTDFKERVDRIAGKSTLTADTMEPQSTRSKLKMVRDMRLSVDKRASILIDLEGDGAWELLIITFSEFHKAGHYLSAPAQLSPRLTNVDGMAEIAKAFDRRLPAILEAAGSDCEVLIFAVHGMRQQFDYSGFGEQLLAVQAGQEPIDPETQPDLIRRVRNLIPDPVHRFIWRNLPARVRANRQHQISTGRADLVHDRLFPVVHDGHPAVRANLKGRERDGFVSKEEADELLGELEALAAGFSTEDGVPAFPQMWRSEIEEPGPRSHRLPDAFLVSNPEIRQATVLRNERGIVLKSSRAEVRDGVHTASGFCYFRPSKDVSVTRRKIDNTDFGPTVLRLLGITPSVEFDGTSFVA
jgi:predicted AlkP superfamily phosphohydrolase/phosphomutase